jgi:hypothetical protein
MEYNGSRDVSIICIKYPIHQKRHSDAAYEEIYHIDKTHIPDCMMVVAIHEKQRKVPHCPEEGKEKGGVQ